MILKFAQNEMSPSNKRAKVNHLLLDVTEKNKGLIIILEHYRLELWSTLPRMQAIVKKARRKQPRQEKEVHEKCK